MVSQTEQFFRDYWQSRATVRRSAALGGNMTLAEKLAWQDVLRRHLGVQGSATRVLDVGTGVGEIARIVAAMRVQVTGVDWSTDQLEVAQQRWDESSGRRRGSCQFVEGDAHQLQFDRAAFDAVLAINVLTQLLNPQRALLEWARVLKPGGKLVIVEDDRNSAEARKSAQVLQKARLADDPQGAAFIEKQNRCPLWQADGSTIAGALQLAEYENIAQTQVAGQLVRQGRHRWQRYEVGYMLISAEKGGSISI